MKAQPNEITSEIESTAPTLLSLAKRDGFVVPKGYFDVLETTLQTQALPHAFEAPRTQSEATATYFKELETRILEQTVKSEPIALQPNKPRTTRIVRMAALSMSIAASVAVLWYFAISNDSTCQTFDCLLAQMAMNETELVEVAPDLWSNDLPNTDASLFTLLDDEVLTEFIVDDEEAEWLLSELITK